MLNLQQEHDTRDFGFMVPAGFKGINSEAWIEMGVRLVARGAFEGPEKFVNSVNFLESLLGEKIDGYKKDDKRFWDIYEEELTKIKKRIASAHDYNERIKVEEAKLKFKLFIRVIRQLEPETEVAVIRALPSEGVDNANV